MSELQRFIDFAIRHQLEFVVDEGASDENPALTVKGVGEDLTIISLPPRLVHEPGSDREGRDADLYLAPKASVV